MSRVHVTDSRVQTDKHEELTLKTSERGWKVVQSRSAEQGDTNKRQVGCCFPTLLLNRVSGCSERKWLDKSVTFHKIFAETTRLT